jgi:ParB-like chromosome segregation protein Spo0J
MTKSLRNLKVEYREVASLKPYARNPRTHSPKQIRQIADSIVQFGFTLPILVDARQRVLAGHGRLQAARLLGLERVPTICLDYLSRAQKRAYLIADNKLAENAGWNRELLALELQYLSELEINFDLTIIGFETAEIDLMIQGLDSNDAADDADEISEISESSPPVSRLGDLWLLDEHRLLCADATVKESFERLLTGKKAQMRSQIRRTTSPSTVMFAGPARSNMTNLSWPRVNYLRASSPVS